jgi:hypothetical protein
VLIKPFFYIREFVLSDCSMPSSHQKTSGQARYIKHNDDPQSPPTDQPQPSKPSSNQGESDPVKKALFMGVGISFTQAYACSPFDVLKTYRQMGKPVKICDSPLVLWHGAFVNAVCKSGSYAAQTYYISNAPDKPTLFDITSAGCASAFIIHVPEYTKTRVQHAPRGCSVFVTLSIAIKNDPVSPLRGLPYTIYREVIFSVFLWNIPGALAPHLPKFISEEWKDIAASVAVAPLAAAVTIHADTLKTLSHIGPPDLSGPKRDLFFRLGRGFVPRAGLFVIAFPVIKESRGFYDTLYEHHFS